LDDTSYKHIILQWDVEPNKWLVESAIKGKKAKKQEHFDTLSTFVDSLGDKVVHPALTHSNYEAMGGDDEEQDQTDYGAFSVDGVKDEADKAMGKKK